MNRSKYSVIAFVLVFILTAGARAQITVNTLSDGGAGDLGDGFCSLREAIANADFNSDGTSGDCAAGGSSPDTVQFSVSGTIVLSEGAIVFTEDLVVDGPGASQLAISGDGADRIFIQSADLQIVKIQDVTLKDGSAAGKGGAIFNLGAFANLIVDRVHFKNNVSAAGGGAVAVNPTNATLTISNSTFSGNFSGDQFSQAHGGAIQTASAINAVNVTFSGNTARGSGGAMYLDGAGASALLDNATIVYNSAELGGGGIATNSGGNASYKNSIIAGNVVEGAADDSNLDCSGSNIFSEDFNVLGPGTGCDVGSDIETNAVYTVVDTLADNGGYVPTHALVAGSPALEAGDTVDGGTGSGGCDSIDGATISTDARGEFRAQGPSYGQLLCDIGAFEAQSAPSGVEASITVLLEGAYAGSGMMSSSLDLPTEHPFSDSLFDGTILDYDGIATVASTASAELADAVDWVLVILKDGGVTVAVQPAFVTLDGTVLNGDLNLPVFDGVPTGGYDIVIAHRNHLAIQSASAVDFTSGTGIWDFTTALGQAITSGGDPMKDLGSSEFGLFACDANADGQVTAPDFNIWNASTTAGETGYRAGDCNLDGQVTAPDFNLWNANTTAGATSQVP